MNRLSEKFSQLKKEKRKALIPYVTPEFPVQGTTVPLVLALEKAGAACVELGVPFSDPLADGPTIQQSSGIALKNGVTVDSIFESVQRIREKSNIPIILMGYVNPILFYGMEKFLKTCTRCGVDGLIIPDLPPEESSEFHTLAVQYGISIIYLIAPTSSDERIRRLDSLSTDFTYCVSVTGVTGTRSSFGDHFDEFLQRVKNNTSKPFVVGFGITNKTQIERITKTADGVVVGSAFLQSIGTAHSVDEVLQSGTKFISTLV